jgi:hypothetical protein
MFKFVQLLLKLTHVLAQREEANQRRRQVKFKNESAAKAKVLKAAADRAHAQARALSSRAATASAESTIGSNDINEAERVAASLRASLDFVVKK